MLVTAWTPNSLHDAGAARRVPRLLGGAGGGAAVVEGPHRELRAGLADGLGGDDAHRLAHLGQAPGGQHPPVALAAHAPPGLAGQHGADLDPLVAGVLDARRRAPR